MNNLNIKMNVSILHSNDFSPNEVCFLYPLYFNKRLLNSAYNIRLTFINNIESIDSDVCIISSKWFSTLWAHEGPEYIFSLLVKLKSRVNKLIWYDISDSTGTTHFMVLPYVDLYLKNQIFVDKHDYLKQYYGSRVYCDYIHKKFLIDDTDPGEAHLNFFPDKRLLDKVICGWNSGLAYFGSKRHLQSYLFSKRPQTLKYFRNKWIAPANNKKSIPVSCRIGLSYSRNTIAESRRVIVNQLRDLIPTGKISHKAYYSELKQSIAAVSPFGLGEISLRDFEVTINGAAIIKQDMSHVETWPNLWIKEQTYLDFSWDLSDIEEKVQFAIDNPLKMRQYAESAQELYTNVLASREGSQMFCERLRGLIEG